MYSVYNVQMFASARVDEVEGTIVIELHGKDKPFVINKDDELYEHHLKNIFRRGVPGNRLYCGDRPVAVCHMEHAG